MPCAPGEADVAVSAGNTGALMAMARFILKTLPGISRPAIAAIWPTLRSESVVLDVGATIGADARQLVEFAVMGEAMARCLFGLEKPTVGLLNVGVEEIKGVEQVKEAGRILRELEPADRLCRLRRGRRHRQGHGRCGGDRGLHRQHRAEGGRRHGQATGHLSQGGCLQPDPDVDGWAPSSRPAPSGRSGPHGSRASTMAACSSDLNGVVVKSHGGTDALGFATAIDVASKWSATISSTR